MQHRFLECLQRGEVPSIVLGHPQQPIPSCDEQLLEGTLGVFENLHADASEHACSFSHWGFLSSPVIRFHCLYQPSTCTFSTRSSLFWASSSHSRSMLQKELITS